MCKIPITLRSCKWRSVLLLLLSTIVCVAVSAEAADDALESTEYAVIDVKNPDPFRVTAYIQGVGPSVGSNLLSSTISGADKFCIPPGGVVLFGSGDETLPVQGGADGLEGLVSELVSGSASGYSSTDIAIVEGVIEYMSDVEEVKDGAKGYLVPAGKMPETNNFSRKDGCGCSTNMDFGTKIEEVFDLTKNNLSITEYIEQNAVEPYSVKVDTDAVPGGVGEERLEQITEMIAQIQGAASDPDTEETSEASADEGAAEETSEQASDDGDAGEEAGQDQEGAAGPDDGDGGGDTGADAPGTSSDTSTREGTADTSSTSGNTGTNTNNTTVDLQPPDTQTPPTPPGTSGPSGPSNPTSGEPQAPPDSPPIPAFID